MDRARLIQDMARVVGAEYVVSDPVELKVYETDGLTIYKATPDVVVLPKSTEEVVEVVRLCARERIPFVPRGAGTGLSGGALAVEGGVVIGFNRMNRVLEVDYPNQRAVIEPGLVNIWLTNQVSPEGYYYAPDPASQTRVQRRRQRGRELGRSALPQVRGHHQPRPRSGGGPGLWRDRRGRELHPGPARL